MLGGVIDPSPLQQPRNQQQSLLSQWNGPVQQQLWSTALRTSASTKTSHQSRSLPQESGIISPFPFLCHGRESDGLGQHLLEFPESLHDLPPQIPMRVLCRQRRSRPQPGQTISSISGKRTVRHLHSTPSQSQTCLSLILKGTFISSHQCSRSPLFLKKFPVLPGMSTSSPQNSTPSPSDKRFGLGRT